MASETTTKLQFGPFTCPSCDSDEKMSVTLNDLTKIMCVECGDEFDLAEMVEKAHRIAAQWSAVAEWVEAARGIIERATAK